MDYLKPFDFIQLKAFFLALQQGNFKSNPNQSSAVVLVDGVRIPVDKTHCLELLRAFPDLQGEQFKDDPFLIKYLSNPSNIKRILGRLTTEQQIELTKLLAEKPAVTETAGEPSGTQESPSGQTAPGENTSTMAGGMPGGFPSMPSISSPRIHGIPRTAPPQGLGSETPKLVVANKSGVVAEALPSKIYIANKSGVVTGERTIGPTSFKGQVSETPQPKLVSANSSGVVAEAPPPKSGLVTANSSGAVRQAPPTAIHIADKSGNIVGERSIKPPPRFNFSAFKSSLSSGFKKVQNFASRANPFLKINLGRIGKGLGEIAGGLGRGIVSPGLTGGANMLGKGLMGGVNTGANISGRFRNLQSSLGSRSSLLSPKKGTLKWIFGIIFLSFFGFSLIAGITGTTPSGEAGPISNGLDYTLPLKDPTIQPLDIRSEISAVFPQAKIEYWDKIIQVSRDAGLNPAVALALWIEETGASQTTVVKNGGAGIPTARGDLTVGHLGCAPTEDQTIDESLSCLIKFVNLNNFTNNDFSLFMAKYSGGPPSAPFSNNPNFTTNFRSWYSKLVPTGPGALTNITPQLGYTPNGGQGIISCPLNGATTITNGSMATGGHCSPSYEQAYAVCIKIGNPGYTGRDTALDITSSDQLVYLPKIKGADTLKWTVDEAGNVPITETEGGGLSVAAYTTVSDITYRIRFVHIGATNLKISDVIDAGTLIGQYYLNNPYGAHVHITIQENGVFKPADLYFNLCR